MINITNECNMELMARYPDGYFDLAIVDPPYGIGADKAQNSAAEQREKANGKSKAGRGWKKYKETEWDNAIPTDEYFKELFRVSKNQIIWGGNYFPFIWNFSSGLILWDKGQRDFSLADGEMAWYSQEKAMRIFNMSRGEALAQNNKGVGRFHPTQKPVKLYSWLIQNYTQKGYRILDTHIGSASIAIAVDNANKMEKMELELVGCELDPDYYKAATQRIEIETNWQPLF